MSISKIIHFWCIKGHQISKFSCMTKTRASRGTSFQISFNHSEGEYLSAKLVILNVSCQNLMWYDSNEHIETLKWGKILRNSLENEPKLVEKNLENLENKEYQSVYTLLRNSLKTSEMLGNNVRNHTWKFQVQKNTGSQNMEPYMIWACAGSFWANSIVSSLVHVSDLILHITVVWDGALDLAILSLMFYLINYA